MRKRGRTHCWGLGTRGGCVTPLVRGPVSLRAAFPGFVASKKARNGVKRWDLVASSKAACRQGSDRR